MTVVQPTLTDAQLRRLPSQAEARVYEACAAGIGDRRFVLFSLPWIRVSPHGTVRDGETDFIVFDEDKGILIVEVKGGGVHLDSTTGEWTSTDRHGNSHPVKNPFSQAKTEKYALLDHLKSEAAWTRLKIRPTLGHAVLFPDLDACDNLRGPDRPSEIIGWRHDLTDLSSWLDSVLDYWSGGESIGVGAAGMAVVQRLFFSDIDVKPLLASVIEEEEAERIRLTEEQARVLRVLGGRRRAVVSGGAGTGKTLLAMQKAQDLANEGLQTLLLCYNRPLANHLARCCHDHPNLTAMSFHQLCDKLVKRASADAGEDLLDDAASANPGLSRFDVHFPHALAMATELIADRFDAIVVDEAQDFGQEYWFPIELLLRDSETSTLFLFYDHNQALYSRVSTFPIVDDPFLLTRNCRNTRFIHDAAYRYYSGEETEPPPIEGEPLDCIVAPSRGSQARRLHSYISNLITADKVAPEGIAVLVPSRGHEDFYGLLENRPLPRPCKWAIEEYGRQHGVHVDTWQRFKGLEASIVLLWGVDELDPETDREVL
ncbi:MAG: AAA family ATPase, partial [Candidatus Latescibacteria bacterium]|nr:AAA family ATPase [Candidatus Latescibacterota bacterium]